MEGFLIREIKPEDIDAVCKTVEELCREDLHLAILHPDANLTKEDELEWIRSNIKGMEKGEKVVLGVFKSGEYGGSAEIKKDIGRHSHYGTFGIALKKSFRGKGLGKRLSKEVEERAKKIGITHLRLEVSAENEAAISLYKKLGYEPAGMIPQYARRRGRLGDYLIMTKKL
jgi:ribosomal protein S18 acetylase RimI-like enzyme